MDKKSLEEKTISELRVLARKLGVVQKRDWKKKDLVRAIARQKAAPAGKTAGKKTVAKKTAKKTKAKTAPKKAVRKKTTATKAKKTAARVRKAAPKNKAGGAPRAAGTVPAPAQKRSVIERISRIPHEKPASLHGAMPVSSRVTLMVVDPYKLFVYWDINHEDVEQIAGDGEGFLMVLRVFFFREDEQTGFFDVTVHELSGKKYVEVVPDRSYQVEFAVIKGETYFPIVKSRMKTTPAYTIDRQGMTEEQSALFTRQYPQSKPRLSS